MAGLISHILHTPIDAVFKLSLDDAIVRYEIALDIWKTLHGKPK